MLMNILYLTISDFSDLSKRGIYTDLIREFLAQGHKISIITPSERRYGKPTQLLSNDGCTTLRLKTGNLFGTNLVEKGLSNLLLEWQYKRAIQRFFGDIKFDLVLYASPPVTLAKVIEYVKRRDGAKSYLMLKDIFPQNAIDVGLLKKTGWKNFLYRFFRNKEKKFYEVSDFIGCMSEANVRYLLNHNPEIDSQRVEVCPNSIAPIERADVDCSVIYQKYKLPSDKTLFVYGGNFGLPQGVDFIIEALRANKDRTDAHFVLCGKGTEFYKVQRFVDLENPSAVTLLSHLPKDEYDQLISVGDVGLIFLDHRFTIPNFPSRLISYLENRMPVLVASDINTDVGQVVTEGGFGWGCESNDVVAFTNLVDKFCKNKENLSKMGQKARLYLEEHYTVAKQYETILSKMKNTA